MQAQERRNAENLSESVGVSARAMQRFLTEARWSDDAVIGRLQEYLAPRLGHPEAVWVFDGSDFPKQGRKSAGVARQYCGRLGKVANCQAGMFLAYVSPLGRALVDKRLYLSQVWASDDARCAAAGVPEERRAFIIPSPVAPRSRSSPTLSGVPHWAQTIYTSPAWPCCAQITRARTLRNGGTSS